jgi:hypothetical protein
LMIDLPRRLVKGPQCDDCLLGADITPLTETSPTGKRFIIPACYVGDLDERTGMPLSLCLNRKVME